MKSGKAPGLAEVPVEYLKRCDLHGSVKSETHYVFLDSALSVRQVSFSICSPLSRES